MGLIGHAGLKAGFLGFNIKGNKAMLFDGGDRPFSATLLSDVAKAVVGILRHPEETKNKLVYVHSARLTQKQLVAVYDNIRDTKLETTVVSSEDVVKAGTEKFANGDFSGFVDQFLVCYFGEGYGGDYEGRESNGLFGIELLDQEGIEEVVKASL